MIGCFVACEWDSSCVERCGSLDSIVDCQWCPLCGLGWMLQRLLVRWPIAVSLLCRITQWHVSTTWGCSFIGHPRTCNDIFTMTCNNIQQHLTTSNNIQQHATTPNNIQRHSTTSNDIHRNSTTSNNFQQHATEI